MIAPTKRPYRRAEATRQHVLDVASRLFYTDGIRAVGIDRVAAEAEVTTATLYRLFGSKEGLVAAYLHRTDEEWFERLERTVATRGFAGFFDDLDARVCDADYRGCAFSMALAEYPDPDSEVHREAIAHNQRVRARFRELTAAAGVADPATTAEQLQIVMSGIYASAPNRTPGAAPGPGAALARRLLGAD
jgi:AcrR family transcriptional regulator